MDLSKLMESLQSREKVTHDTVEDCLIAVLPPLLDIWLSNGASGAPALAGEVDILLNRVRDSIMSDPLFKDVSYMERQAMKMMLHQLLKLKNGADTND